ncbi:hypothetical protein J2W23_001776 [Variovorax boronicumulans]|uniref:DUF4124 domain-containing protein n=1 Tax=Variovorax boronicumulans TaxID=436515 RepID=UPI002784868A|nr:DUF4124 domain-containing protein [Variovorax boronicumulans]MDQ0013397.1 hypothetical protein [Variovorax boronicumulans]
MQSPNPAWHVLSAALAALLLPSASHAEIYKWVDAKGQTHYSERKADAGDARTVEVKPAPAPPQSAAPKEDWRAWSRATSPTQTATGVPPYGPPVARPRSVSGGRENGTDASRCALARDVLAGLLQHSNGKPIDQYDRDVAQNDIKSFCK